MFRHGLLPLRLSACLLPKSRFSHLAVRHGSLNSAIERGLRKSQWVDRPAPRYPRNDRTDTARESYKSKKRALERAPAKGRRDYKPRGGTPEREPTNVRRDYKPRRQMPEEEYPDSGFDEEEFLRTGLLPSMARTQPQPPRNKEATKSPMHRRRKRQGGAHEYSDEVPEARKLNVKPPKTIPYTTSASEFIYGTNAVEAALRCSRRKLYNLYVYQAVDEELSATKITMRKLALTKGIKIKMAFGEWINLLDAMSEKRPHNGVVLEASPLPRLPVTGFRAVQSIEDDHFRVDLGPQTREEADVNGVDNRVPIHSSHRKRYPVTLLLDGIVDTGNLGAIIRSAYFLGIDAILFAGRTSAPLSPVAIKASAGAAENMTLFHVKNEVDFIKQSKANGWRFYAADAPAVGSTLVDPLGSAGGDSGPDFNSVTQAPTVIMMGSEATGLSSHIKAHADSIVSIPGARLDPHFGASTDPARVDSLNVSVAAALLMEMFVRVPIAISGMPNHSG